MLYYTCFTFLPSASLHTWTAFSVSKQLTLTSLSLWLLLFSPSFHCRSAPAAMEHAPLSLKFLCYLGTLHSPKRTIKSYQWPPLCPSSLFLIFSLPHLPCIMLPHQHTHLGTLSPLSTLDLLWLSCWELLCLLAFPALCAACTHFTSSVTGGALHTFLNLAPRLLWFG